MGVVGGLLGALFNCMNKCLAKYRMRNIHPKARFIRSVSPGSWTVDPPNKQTDAVLFPGSWRVCWLPWWPRWWYFWPPFCWVNVGTCPPRRPITPQWGYTFKYLLWRQLKAGSFSQSLWQKKQKIKIIPHLQPLQLHVLTDGLLFAGFWQWRHQLNHPAVFLLQSNLQRHGHAVLQPAGGGHPPALPPGRWGFEPTKRPRCSAPSGNNG